MTTIVGGLMAVWLAIAAPQRPSDLVKWTAKAPPTSVIAGARLKVELTAAIESGWHIYALTQPANGPIPMTIAVPSAPGFRMLVKQIDSPPPVVTRDPTFQSDTHSYEDQVTLSVPFAVTSAATSGKHALPIEITYQACSSRICLRPFTEKLAVDVTVARPAKGQHQPTLHGRIPG